MKRWLGALLAALFVAGILVPLLRPPASAPPVPLAAPERPEPVLSLLRTATGGRLSLPMETYVAGVVGAEMGEGFPPEALAAQAILARTYALRLVRLGIEVTDDPGRHQAYKPERVTDAVSQAVASTRGQVVVHGGELVDAVFHSCAGGRTAAAPEGMQAPDKLYLRPVADPPCRRGETWSARFPAAEVAAAAGVAGGAVRSVALGKRGPSGRALTVLVNGREVSTFALRARLGGARMKSNYITGLRLEQGQVVMDGRGFGHGVGMSQWGAAVLAEEKGFTAEEIIRHYFTDVAIETWW